ncbi:BZ3500_MvSof-1268-A1-R1_Chr11-2g03340 [Microbotryum saponariae]|uniref:BZ3500_MvSof-1268-A1-R1_Chr11-2g03340 protein n=1 Tax=Microbotryum saponariae TaxID=289078 RepID=A0A2X0LBT0_9BASI|nr:BZ3500_MvSof-1268-A1-R1_Chr11-2g03340 [Microbotryum saponariae]SDA03159.1 BZ3501_MvSof-1269-A2-R1_Chr11g02911 [Microbotryum saponariae]
MTRRRLTQHRAERTSTDPISHPNPHRLNTAGPPTRAIVAALILCAAQAQGAASTSYLNGLTHFGQYSPYQPSATYGSGSPEWVGKILQVNILQSNGASDPTSKLSAAMQASVRKVAGRPKYSLKEMEFLSNYTYTLGSEGALMPYGRAESYAAGVLASTRYGCKKDDDCEPFIRSSASARVKESSEQWLKGFMSEAGYGVSGSVTFPETKGSNNTLFDNCPNLVSSLPSAQEEWRAVWTPAIIERLQRDEDFGLDSLVRCSNQLVFSDGSRDLLTIFCFAQDIVHFSYMCAFESLAINATSPFCGLFRRSELQYIEYDADLDKYYEHSYGARLARSQAVGYLSEVLARLENDRDDVNADRTQVNHTVDSNPKTFPLRAKFMHADFTHDDQLLAVLTLLGFFQDSALSTTLPCPMRTFVASKMVPFAGRLVIEQVHSPIWEHMSWLRHDTVRILVNDKRMDLSKLCTKDALTYGGTVCEYRRFAATLKKIIETATKEFEGCGFVPAN